MAEPSAVSPEGGRSRGRLLLQGLLALLVSVVALWWAFRGADFQEMKESLRRTEPLAVIAFGLGQIAVQGIRILRWGLYMRPLAPRVSNQALFAAANVGIAATFFVPLRLGEFVRPMLIARSGAPFGGAISSVVVERIADGLCAVAMFFFFFALVPDHAPIPDQLGTLSSTAAIVFGGGLLFLVLAAMARKPVLGATRAVVGRISTRLADRLVGMTSTFLDGLQAVGSPGRAAAYILLTAAFWGGSGVLIWILAESYQPGLPLVAGMFTVPVLVFAVMIPAGPAFAGTFQWGFILGLGAFGLPKDAALVIAVVAHAMQMTTMGLFVGVGFLAAEPGQRKELSTPTAPTPGAP